MYITFTAVGAALSLVQESLSGWPKAGNMLSPGLHGSVER